MRRIIDDGTIEVKLENKFGKQICAVHIRPADISIIDRLNSLMDDFSDIVEPLKECDINADGTAKFESQWAAIKQVEAALIERINTVFDMDEAADIFAKRNAFSSVNGVFFAESVITALGDVVKEAIERESRESAERMSKYLKDA